MSDSPPWWRRLLPRLLLVGGVVLAASLFARELPREQTLVFRLPSTRDVVGLEASWTRLGRDEPAGAVQLTFSKPPPMRVRHRFSSPNGDYEVAVAVRRKALPSEETREITTVRNVHLEGGEVILPLRPE